MAAGAEEIHRRHVFFKKSSEYDFCSICTFQDRLPGFFLEGEGFSQACLWFLTGRKCGRGRAVASTRTIHQISGPGCLLGGLHATPAALWLCLGDRDKVKTFTSEVQLASGQDFHWSPGRPFHKTAACEVGTPSPWHLCSLWDHQLQRGVFRLDLDFRSTFSSCKREGG